MKTYFLLFALLSVASSVRGNFYVPKAKLAGETVYARLTKDAAFVTAVFEFEDIMTSNAKIVYFPIFADDGGDPIKVLLNSRFELEIGGKKIGIAAPCDAPLTFRKTETSAANPRVCWFAADIDDLIHDAGVDQNSRIVIRATYFQPLIRGVFYYLPIIPGTSGNDEMTRLWSYQLIARSAVHLTQVRSKGTDYEQIEDGVVVYLKDGQIVAIQ